MEKDPRSIQHPAIDHEGLPRQAMDQTPPSNMDESALFSTEDIPEEVTDYVSWRIWPQQRGES